MTTTDLWQQIEQVLRDKGASDAWLAYALPDLVQVAFQFACVKWGDGYLSCERGDEMPNRQDERIPGAYNGAGLGHLHAITIPWNKPGSIEQTLGQALAEHGTGGDTYT